MKSAYNSRPYSTKSRGRSCLLVRRWLQMSRHAPVTPRCSLSSCESQSSGNRNLKAESSRHRATSVDSMPREARLDQFLQPMVDQWQERRLSSSLSSFDNFSRLLGLESLQQYLFSRAVHKLPNWSAHPLDQQGKALQIQMQNALDVSLHSPLHPYWYL